MNFANHSPLPFKPISVDEPRLPSFEEAMGKANAGCLPSYKYCRQYRYHPYRRRSTAVIDPIDKYFNTIYDDEWVPLEVPEAIYPPLPVAPLVPGPLLYDRRAALAYQRQVERLGAFILNEFVAGLRRARQG